MTLIILIRLIYEAYFRFPHFRIVRACTKKWRDRDNAQLVTYQLEIKTKKTSSELIFEELWINEKKYLFHICRENRKFASSFGVKEILKLNIVREAREENKPETATKSAKGKLLLSYTFKNKKKHIVVSRFRDPDIRLAFE